MNGGINIGEVVSAGAVPEILRNALDDIGYKCRCGAALEFDRLMQEIRCSSERCSELVTGEVCRALEFIGYTYEEVADKLEGNSDNIKKLLDFAREIVKNNDIKVGCDVLLEEKLTADDTCTKLCRRMNSKKLEKYFNFNELLRMTGIRILCNSSYDLLRGYRSIDEFYTCIDNSGFINVVRRLKLDKSVTTADEILKLLKICRGSMVKIYQRLNVNIPRTSSKTVSGIHGNNEMIGCALGEDTDVIGGISGNKLINILIEDINNRRKKKGLDSIKLS